MAGCACGSMLGVQPSRASPDLVAMLVRDGFGAVVVCFHNFHTRRFISNHKCEWVLSLRWRCSERFSCRRQEGLQ